MTKFYGRYTLLITNSITIPSFVRDTTISIFQTIIIFYFVSLYFPINLQSNNRQHFIATQLLLLPINQ